ncbi:dermonecrotic toxin domain-containing protein [Pseudomonas syringae]|uniref:Dermonecrotic toxin N-terminal domain-containing protein n=1 Tax=Pseudomonas syringae TaxID=317 RepID=A0A085V3P9_PSESX|nr:DUF6543 domain-containing protein [Pseudomonas syringae]KFE50062.1 hypothetical protein IV01_25570 [Pseudomonas syringae]
MSGTQLPWFFSESLSARFRQDIEDARAAEHISAQQALWLASLLSEPQKDVAAPRVDRLLREDGGLMNVELAGALLISDAAATSGEIFFSSVVNGLQRFDSRELLLAALTARFSLPLSDLKSVEYERIEGDFFRQRMLAIVDQQVHQLQHMNERLLRLPSLPTALGKALQLNIAARLPGNETNVFSHLGQIRQQDLTLGTLSLVEMALQTFAGAALPSGLRQQWLDAEGRELNPEQAGPWQQALADVSGGVVAVYETLLADYWFTVAGEGVTHREFAGQVLTERFVQHLLAGRHDATLTALEYAALKTLCLAGEGWKQQVKVFRLSVAIGSQEPVKLVGIFLIEVISGAQPALFLYSSKRGLGRFADIDTLTEHFAGIHGRAEIFDYTSVNDHPLLRAHGPQHQSLHLRLDPVAAAPLRNTLDSVIGLQKRDLSSVLKRSFKSPAQAALAVSDALNILDLLDPRLAPRVGSGLWSEAMTTSESNWAAFNAPAKIAGLRLDIGKGFDKKTMKPWSDYLSDARSRLDVISEARPGLADCARTLLNRYLCVLHNADIDARRMWIRDDDGGVVSLTVLLLERVSGRSGAALPQDFQVYIDPVDSAYEQHLPWLTPDVLNHVLDRSQQAFAQEYRRLNRNVRSGQQQIKAPAVIPAHGARRIREGLLRLELSIQRINGKISDQSLQMLEQVLDRPVFSLRQAFGFQATEVSVPLLVYDSRQPPVVLSNTFVLQQPLYGDGKPLLWTAVAGLREFDSFTELELDLNARLAFPGSRQRWLSLMNPVDREKISRYLKQGAAQHLTISLARVEGHFLEHLESGERQRQLLTVDAAYEMALDWQVDAGLFVSMLMSSALDDKAGTAIDAIGVQLELMVLSEHIPQWLSKATSHDLWKFRKLLVRFDQLYSSRKLIPVVSSLDEYALDHLRQRLLQDFPSVQLDPDQISITLTRYTAAPTGTGDIPSSIPAATVVISESLTQFAINRFSCFQDATLRVSCDDGTPLPDSLDAAYIREMVRTLDVGAGYEQYLGETFSENAPDYANRLSQFTEQAPYGLLLMAFRLKLQGKLSSTAYDFVENVISMPDGLARLPVDGRAITFSPLKLVAGNDSAAGFVRAVYLITPADQTQGPWILHAPADDEFFLKEYAGQTEFLNALQTSTALQAMLNDRLDPALQLVYKWASTLQPLMAWGTGGLADLSEYHPEHAKLVIEPLQENVLHCLLRASEQVILINARKRSVSNAQDDSAQNRFLLGLGGEQVLMFMPGRIGGIIGLLQARDLLNASLESATDKHWGQATAEFTTALAVLIASRQQLEEGGMQRADDSAVADDMAAPRWHDPQLQVDPDGRLQPFEAHDVSLSSLQHDRALNVFQDNIRLKQYAAVLGKVYEVKTTRSGWCVVKGVEEGPHIKRDAGNRWVIDSDVGERHDGSMVTRLRTHTATRSIEDVFVTSASGIAEIERMFPQKALQIREAHALARLYLENALNNLTLANPQSELDPRTARIIKDFFGVRSLGNVSVIPIKQILADIYVHLIDPRLSPNSSQRFVVGTNTVGNEQTNAFIFEGDPQMRIFLSERFFSRPPNVRLKPLVFSRGSFNLGTHYRATTLIHEISHVASGTHDIAYVAANVPFLDLIEDTGAYRARMKLMYEKSQQNLSHLALRDELFRTEDDDGWRDFQAVDGNVKNEILKITGTRNLEAARDRFIHDAGTRARVILNNADSVALLVTLLGRERFLPRE